MHKYALIVSFLGVVCFSGQAVREDHKQVPTTKVEVEIAPAPEANQEVAVQEEQKQMSAAKRSMIAPVTPSAPPKGAAKLAVEAEINRKG